jgi:hypothetical protein
VGGSVAYKGASSVASLGGWSVFTGASALVDVEGQAGISTSDAVITLDSNLDKVSVDQAIRGEYYSHLFTDPVSKRPVTSRTENGVFGVNAIANGVDVAGNIGVGFTQVQPLFELY